MMLKAELKMLETSIQNVLDLVEGCTIDQLNKIPDGFSNNLVWQLGHLVVTQKLLIYGLSNNSLNLDTELVEKYRKGTRPNAKVTELEVEDLKSELAKFKADLEKDIQAKLFKKYAPYLTSYNFEITNFHEALSMVNLHYGLHVSSILDLKKRCK
ncbi:MAG: DinB family protein [Putridiphycobacter sp.]